MKKLKFEYIKIGSHKRPIIPVRLSYKSLSVNIPALIDSGADFNVFPLSIAKDLGLKLNIDKPIIFSGVGEKSQKLTGFFDHLDQISFFYKRGKVVLKG